MNSHSEAKNDISLILLTTDDWSKIPCRKQPLCFKKIPSLDYGIFKDPGQHQIDLFTAKLTSCKTHTV